jgi:hypothetical protein
MLSGFPASAGTDPDVQIRVYLLSVEGLATEAIGRAARLFITGKVKGQNRDFAPSCASFAEECRAQQLIIEAENRPRIEPPTEKSDDGPRVDPRKLQLLKKALSGSLSAKRKLARMFPDNPIIARAAQDGKEAAE